MFHRKRSEVSVFDYNFMLIKVKITNFLLIVGATFKINVPYNTSTCYKYVAPKNTIRSKGRRLICKLSNLFSIQVSTGLSCLVSCSNYRESVAVYETCHLIYYSEKKISPKISTWCKKSTCWGCVSKRKKEKEKKRAIRFWNFISTNDMNSFRNGDSVIYATLIMNKNGKKPLDKGSSTNWSFKSLWWFASKTFSK